VRFQLGRIGTALCRSLRVFSSEALIDNGDMEKDHGN
jgi:hypothetical protein